MNRSTPPYWNPILTDICKLGMKYYIKKNNMYLTKTVFQNEKKTFENKK